MIWLISLTIACGVGFIITASLHHERRPKVRKARARVDKRVEHYSTHFGTRLDAEVFLSELFGIAEPAKKKKPYRSGGVGAIGINLRQGNYTHAATLLAGKALIEGVGDFVTGAIDKKLQSRAIKKRLEKDGPKSEAQKECEIAIQEEIARSTVLQRKSDSLQTGMITLGGAFVLLFLAALGTAGLLE